MSWMIGVAKDKGDILVSGVIEETIMKLDNSQR